MCKCLIFVYTVVTVVAATADLVPVSAVSADETRVLQGEIDRLAAAGGGTLRVRSGVHRSGALFFKPGVNLHLEKGAVIQGVDEAAAYPWRETRMIGMTLNYFPALINADRCDGFKITGEGVIDGHGLPVWKAFWPRYHAAHAKRQQWDDVFNGLTRPRVLYVSNSRNVDVSGVTFKNSKFWTTHYYRCENVTVHDCRIVAEKLDGTVGPSTDAIDIDVCTNLTVRRVYMDVNDDAVVVKGGLGPDADKVAKGNGETVNVLVEDCTFGPLCHACLTLGSECPAARNIRMRNCRIEGANALARVKMRGDTPQHLTDLQVENCTGRCNRFLMFGAFAANAKWPECRQHPIPSVMDRLELRGNRIDCRVKYDCHAVPWLSLKEYIEEGNTVNARYKGNPGCTRGARRNVSTLR